ncbi:MAG: hypothetical protein LBH25_11075 [Fibromonadaceae bacterium]|jgi:hypothetical protein|nr:hypothetical protein [Fibromonadaceae bacterium]
MPDVAFFNEMVSELNNLIGNCNKYPQKQVWGCEFSCLKDISTEAKEMYIAKYESGKILDKFYCFWKKFIAKRRQNYLDVAGIKRKITYYPIAILDEDDTYHNEETQLLCNKGLLLTAYFNILKRNKNKIEVTKINKTEYHIKALLAADNFIRAEEILKHLSIIELT